MSPWAVQEQFAQVAANPLYGSNGGNPCCRVWTAGVEPGAPIPDAPPPEIPEQYCVDHIPCWNDAFREENPTYRRWPFMRIMSGLLRGVFAEGWQNNYEHLLTHDGHGFHLNLYPLAEAQLVNWSEPNRVFSGFPHKSFYRAWCVGHRFPGFRQLAQERSPRVIVCSAPDSFRDRFITAFGEPADAAQGMALQVGPYQISQLSVNNGRTTLIISPFFGRRGLMKNEHVDALAGLVRGILDQ